MQSAINKLSDYVQVLKFVEMQSSGMGNAQPALSRSTYSDNEQIGQQPLLESGVSICFVAGTIKANECERMSRLLYRITRGKALTHFQQFEQDGQEKAVYMVVYQDGAIIRDRVQKVCDSFMGTRFEIPQLGERLQATLQQSEYQLIQDVNLLRTSRSQLKEYLRSISGPTAAAGAKASALEIMLMFVAKEKAIYTALNMMKSREKTYIGFIWCPVAVEVLIRQALSEFQTTEFQSWRPNYEEPHQIQPPTYFKLNDVTWTF